MKTSMMHNGHEFVDLGLSVNWAISNLGAQYPEGSRTLLL